MASGRPDDDAVVIPRPSDGGVMSAKSFNVWRGDTFVPALEAAGLPRARPYDLRHSFASLLLHEGRSPTRSSEHPARNDRCSRHVREALPGRRLVGPA